MKLTNFKRELECLINRMGVDEVLATPDYVLAEFVMASLKAFDCAAFSRDKHKSVNSAQVAMDFEALAEMSPAETAKCFREAIAEDHEAKAAHERR